MVFKCVSCDSWWIRLVPDGHLRGWQDLFFPAPTPTRRKSGLQGLTVLRFPGLCPALCLQQMWFTGQGSLIKQLSANGNSFRCCRVPGTLCDGNGGHPLWSSSLAHLHGHPSKREAGISVLHLFYSPGGLCLSPGFFFSKPWPWAWCHARLSLTGLPGLGPFLLKAHLGWHNREYLLVPKALHKWLKLSDTQSFHMHIHSHTMHIHSHTTQSHTHAYIAHITHMLTYSTQLHTMYT